MEVNQIAGLLNDTLKYDGNVVRSATEALGRLSPLPHFPFSLISIAIGGENQGQRVAAAAYLKNITKQNFEGNDPHVNVSKEFKDCLMRALIQAEQAVLKVLVEVFRIIVVAKFVKENSWPELVPELRSAIQSSNLINGGANCGWNTINALSVLLALTRPFQYFLNPKVAKEPVPPQLEQITKEILVPLLAVFHNSVEKALSAHGRLEMENEKTILLICKCIYFSVRSYMPSALVPLLPSFCYDLIRILGSLSFGLTTLEDGSLLRLKSGKRSLLIFRALVTRHRKFSDRLMPDIINCVLKLVKYSTDISKFDFLSEKIISFAFDVISNVLETGPGWRIVSPHFLSLLESAIFPALVLNEKDMSEWEDDADEYIRKNLPFELEEISGWREDLLTARKSAINLLGVISMSKGPPIGTLTNDSSASSKRKKGEKAKRNQSCSMGELLVLPFLSKFPVPSDINASQTKVLDDYFGVLMAYGGLQDFLSKQKPEYTTNLVRTRVLPLYTVSVSLPYLVATANWVLGELASCLPEAMNTDVYDSLMKALAMPDAEDISCYPVRVSAAGAIAGLLENDYQPPEWLPLLQAVISRIGKEDEESPILYQLLCSVVEAGNENVAIQIPYIVSSLVSTISKCIPSQLDAWPQVVERGFATLAVMAHSWETFMLEEVEKKESSKKFISGQAAIGGAFSALLQQTWHTAMLLQDQEGDLSPPPACIDDSSALLRSIMLTVSGSNAIQELKVSELLLVWAHLIANWHAWEESEDMSIFDCIKEAVSVQKKYGLKNFIVGPMPLPPAPPIPKCSIIEGIGAFVSEAIAQYPSATWRACSCVHILLHVPSYSFETEVVKHLLVIIFSRAAFSRFKEIRSKPCPLWKPLLLAISSCFLCYPDTVRELLEKEEDRGFAIWASALGHICNSSFEPALSAESEMKLIVISLAKVIEQLLTLGNPSGSLLRDCLSILMEASVRLKEIQDENEEEEEEEEEEEDEDDDEETDCDEDSEGDEHEETEEEFLDRYAKAAAALENGTIIEEGDAEDQDEGIELGTLEEVEHERVVWSLVERYHHMLIQQQAIPSSQVVSSFVQTFPEYDSLIFGMYKEQR